MSPPSPSLNKAQEQGIATLPIPPPDLMSSRHLTSPECSFEYIAPDHDRGFEKMPPVHDRGPIFDESQN
ncbi:hypothetical protein E2C01_057052 [Portunus trituberculatus]|uniref:Uncharacterized protein n=1 Tax=Portunus trituberculatus TaxID=210409 RepID=A0A5B7GSF8_PORTR|nr:hypothetical protein [Portunus trituberculatus]